MCGLDTSHLLFFKNSTRDPNELDVGRVEYIQRVRRAGRSLDTLTVYYKLVSLSVRLLRLEKES
jgi:hypothetical protein